MAFRDGAPGGTLSFNRSQGSKSCEGQFSIIHHLEGGVVYTGGAGEGALPCPFPDTPVLGSSLKNWLFGDVGLTLKGWLLSVQRNLLQSAFINSG